MAKTPTTLTDVAHEVGTKIGKPGGCICGHPEQGVPGIGANEILFEEAGYAWLVYGAAMEAGLNVQPPAIQTDDTPDEACFSEWIVNGCDDAGSPCGCAGTDADLDLDEGWCDKPPAEFSFVVTVEYAYSAEEQLALLAANKEDLG